MKRVSVIIATILFLLFRTTAIANAQHDLRGNEQNRSNQSQQHQSVRIQIQVGPIETGPRAVQVDE